MLSLHVFDDFEFNVEVASDLILRKNERVDCQASASFGDFAWILVVAFNRAYIPLLLYFFAARHLHIAFFI